MNPCWKLKQYWLVCSGFAFYRLWWSRLWRRLIRGGRFCGGGFHGRRVRGGRICGGRTCGWRKCGGRIRIGRICGGFVSWNLSGLGCGSASCGLDCSWCRWRGDSEPMMFQPPLIDLMPKDWVPALNSQSQWSHICDHFFLSFRKKLFSPPIFVPSAGQGQRRLAELSGYTHVHFYFYEAHCFDELSRGSFSCLDLK